LDPEDEGLDPEDEDEEPAAFSSHAMKVSIVNSLGRLEPDPADGAVDALGEAGVALAGAEVVDGALLEGGVAGVEEPEPPAGEDPEPELAPLKSAGPGGL
jgi:hypothetical protein